MPTHQARKLLRTLVSLFSSHLPDIPAVLWRVGRRLVRLEPHEGMYEVLAYVSRLELRDIKKKHAVFYKRQKVRFLQDRIIAFQDKAWGDGEIFADYRCSPGVPVDRYREGHRWRVLISLRATKNRGDIETFHIERTIKDGFTNEVEDFQTEIDHVTRELAVSVVFPRKRFPKQVLLIEQNASRTRTLGPRHRLMLPDGRLQVTWRTIKPQRFEAYILRWVW